MAKLPLRRLLTSVDSPQVRLLSEGLPFPSEILVMEHFSWR